MAFLPAGMIGPMSIDVVYTAESTASGGGRDGHVRSSDAKIDLDTRPYSKATRGNIDVKLVAKVV